MEYTDQKKKHQAYWPPDLGGQAEGKGHKQLQPEKEDVQVWHQADLTTVPKKLHKLGELDQWLKWIKVVWLKRKKETQPFDLMSVHFYIYLNHK